MHAFFTSAETLAPSFSMFLHVHALVDVNFKRYALHGSWQGHLLHVLVELKTKSETLQASWQTATSIRVLATSPLPS